MNVGHKGGHKSLILYEAIRKHQKLKNDEERLDQEKKIAVLFERGALINNQIVEEGRKNLGAFYARPILDRYTNQGCVVCRVHKQDMEDIPCINKHENKFLCRKCYDQIKSETKRCPFDCEELGAYDSEFGLLCENKKDDKCAKK